MGNAKAVSLRRPSTRREAISLREPNCRQPGKTQRRSQPVVDRDGQLIRGIAPINKSGFAYL
jgi:hypothetical protein